LLRFAPNPISNMNINHLRIVLLNYIVSISKNENLVIRIEDSNKKEDTEVNTKKILEILNLFSINYKHTINQSDHIKYHSQFAMQLLINKKAFNCFCSDEVLQKEKDEAKEKNIPYNYSGFCENLSDAVTFECEAPFTVRIKKPQENITFTDTIYGKIESTPTDIDSFVILNHDKTPTYNFACAIDDMLSDISTIIRDKKYLQDTAKQIHVRNMIDYTKEIEYIHIPSISNDNITIQSLIDEGYLPAAITNYLLSLGLDTPSEIFTLEEAVKWFDISNISKEELFFDIEKLKKINKTYLNNMDELRLSKILGYSDNDIGTLAKIYLKDYSTIVELKTKINNIFSEKNPSKELEENVNKIKQCFNNAPFIKEFDEFKQYIISNTDINNENINSSLTFVLTNDTNEEDLNKIYPLIRNYLGEIIK